VAIKESTIVIKGIGIDVVDIARFQESLERTPALKVKIFTPTEAQLKISSLAARFAAKEALVKALDAQHVFNWHDVEIINEESGKPTFLFTGALAVRVEDLMVHLTISHESGIATAMVILEGP
jgi:holo-[acyl-carrier protein] synthase